MKTPKLALPKMMGEQIIRKDTAERWHRELRVPKNMVIIDTKRKGGTNGR
jgi:hypothetical protein